MKFRVWCDDFNTGPEDGRVVEALNAQAAVERWAQWRDANSSEYTIANGNAVIAHVRFERGGTVWNYEVVGEAVPEYTARAKP